MRGKAIDNTGGLHHMIKLINQFTVKTRTTHKKMRKKETWVRGKVKGGLDIKGQGSNRPQSP